MIDWIALAAGVMMQPSMTCRTIVDFADADERQRWQVVNDGVMGGLSKGRMAAVGDAVRFSGEINTDGGGFSSIRRSVNDGMLEGASAIRVTMRGDARAYQLSLRSDAAYRGRYIAYRGTLEPTGEGDWKTATVTFDQLDTSIFGQRVPAPDFDPSAARAIGFILADGQDGPFDMQIRKIEAC